MAPDVRDVVGLLPSVNFDRLVTCLDSLLISGPLPVVCLCQGMEPRQERQLLARYGRADIRFHFIRMPAEPSVVDARRKLMSLAGEARCFFHFDDDFTFGKDAVAVIRDGARRLLGDPVAGAVMFNRANGPRLTDSRHQAFDPISPDPRAPAERFFRFNPFRSFSALWTNGGILTRRSAFIGFDEGNYLFGDDIGIFLTVHLRGYDILACDIPVHHPAGETRTAYHRRLKATYFPNGVTMPTGKAVPFYRRWRSDVRAWMVYAALADRNYIAGLMAAGDVEMVVGDSVDTMVTAQGHEKHRRARGELIGMSGARMAPVGMSAPG